MNLKNITALVLLIITNWGISQSSLVITEIMYNPPEAGTDSSEFIEIYNNTSGSIDLTNYTCTGGFYTFPNVSLAAGGYYVIAISTSGFTNTYGFAPDDIFIGGLNNGGESIVLKDPNGIVVDSVNYDDVAPWPFGSAQGQVDQGGASLILCDPNSDNNDGSNWSACTNPIGIVVNLANVLASPGMGDNCCIETSSSQTFSECGGFSITVGTNTYTTTGIYLDTVPNVAGCDSIITTDLTIINPSSSIISEITCNSYTSPSGNYMWTISDTYMDTIPNSAGCDSVITINLIVNMASSSSITEVVCNSYTSPSGNYTWTSSNTYIDTIPNTVGCDSVITINLTINSVNTSVTQAANVLTADETGGTYQWIDCAGMTVINGETNQVYTAIADGDYAVIVTSNGCTDTSSCYTVQVSGLNDIVFVNELIIYPNPTQSKVTVSMSSDMKELSYVVYGAEGKMIFQGNRNGISSFDVDFSKEEPGVYFIQVTIDGRTHVSRIIKY